MRKQTVEFKELAQILILKQQPSWDWEQDCLSPKPCSFTALAFSSPTKGFTIILIPYDGVWRTRP